MRQKQIAVINRREKCWSKQDLRMRWRSQVHDQELKIILMVTNAFIWIAP